MKFDESIPILYVEDDEIDVENLRRSFKRNSVHNPLHIAENGLEALDALRGPSAIEPPPRIVLLDINMPKMNGLEFLEAIRADDLLRHLTIFVLTTSDQDLDISVAHRHNVAGYIVKPVSFPKLVEAIATLKELWGLGEFPNSA